VGFAGWTIRRGRVELIIRRYARARRTLRYDRAAFRWDGFCVNVKVCAHAAIGKWVNCHFSWVAVLRCCLLKLAACRLLSASPGGGLDFRWKKSGGLFNPTKPKGRPFLPSEISRVPAQGLAESRRMPQSFRAHSVSTARPVNGNAHFPIRRARKLYVTRSASAESGTIISRLSSAVLWHYRLIDITPRATRRIVQQLSPHSQRLARMSLAKLFLPRPALNALPLVSASSGFIAAGRTCNPAPFFPAFGTIHRPSDVLVLALETLVFRHRFPATWEVRGSHSRSHQERSPFPPANENPPRHIHRIRCPHRPPPPEIGHTPLRRSPSTSRKLHISALESASQMNELGPSSALGRRRRRKQQARTRHNFFARSPSCSRVRCSVRPQSQRSPSSTGAEPPARRGAN